MHKFLSGLLAGVALLIAAPGALAADVNVRVEGADATLVPRTTVTTAGGFVLEGRRPRPPAVPPPAPGVRSSARRTVDWSGTWFPSDYFVQTIKQESHPSDPYWAFWLNYRPAETGACGTQVQTGDDVLFFVSCFDRLRPAEPPADRVDPAVRSAEPGLRGPGRGSRGDLRRERLRHHGGARERRDRDRRRALVHDGCQRRGARDRGRSQPCRRAGDEAGHVSARPPSMSASTAGRSCRASSHPRVTERSGRDRRVGCATAPCTRAGGRRGCCAAA